ncbi:MAG: hypothetical protein WCC65_02140 [Pseudonocardiaceae bacterium]
MDGMITPLRIQHWCAMIAVHKWLGLLGVHEGGGRAEQQRGA